MPLTISSPASLRRCAMLKDADFNTFTAVYLVCGYTDLRYGIDSLAAIIEKKYKMNLFGPNTLFLFCSRSSSRKIKGLLFSPSIRYRNCSSVMSAASAVVRGQDRDPASNLLYKSRKPSPIHNKPLIRSDLRPQNRNKVPCSKGFSVKLLAHTNQFSRYPQNQCNRRR